MSNSYMAKAIHSLVLDAGPIIKNEPALPTLLGQADTLYTTPMVIDEIRDKTTRSRVETTFLPFLQLRVPNSASMKAISDFARRTGDLEVLSKSDIQIMALAYELECEHNHGDWRLRSVPGQKRLNGAPPDSLKTDQEEPALVSVEESPAPESNVTMEAGAVSFGESMQQDVPLELSSTTDFVSGQEPSFEQGTFSQGIEAADLLQAMKELRVSESDESDDEGWITPSNIKRYQEKKSDGASLPHEEPRIMQVATITTDFAMQNVLLRMNLNLLSTSLQKIRQLKTWVLRCHACFNITKDMTKQFCGRCGKPTLLRTSCSTDKDGNFKVHLKKNMQWNTRGDVYSIPKPVPGAANGKIVAGGGKGGWGQGLILAEDQKEYVQAMTSARRRKERDLMDEDYLPNILSGDRGRHGAQPKVGAGKNVNSKKRNK